MSEFKITLDGGTSKRLLTGGKFCDKDILVTANASAPEGIPEEAFLITGDCSYRFANGGWDWFVEQYGNQITTKDITLASYMFNYSNLKEIPFVINMKKDIGKLIYFLGSSALTKAPTIKLDLVNPSSSNLDFSNLFNSCKKIRDFENAFDPSELEALSNIKVTSAYTCPKYNAMFSSCYSMRQVPSWWYKLGVSEESTVYPSNSNTFYYSEFSTCASLDELNNVPVLNTQGAATSNMFGYFVYNCGRLKKLTFETNEDGTPKIVKWKAQTLDLSSYVGYSNNRFIIFDYNSGITADKQVTDDATYQALKDDPDWFTEKVEYSRYNHDSAVTTINSLPDTSAYASGNIIKFKGAAGSATDGGAINTLTEEEIAVAAAKGWTVTLA